LDGLGAGRWRWWRLRLAVLLAVFFGGLLAFRLGVGTSERPGLADASLFAQLYYTLGLFVLGGMDLGTPAGGPALGRGLLWLVYFGAPAITAGALAELIAAALDADRIVLRRLRGHVVVGGAGSVARVFVDRLFAAEPRANVVVVTKDLARADLAALRARPRVRVVHGDVSRAEMLERVRADRAGRVALLTGDDFANLEAASQLAARAPDQAARTIVHRFLRALGRTSVGQRCESFNTHQLAASGLVAHYMLVHFERTTPLDLVVLAGFGRYGQSVLAELQAQALGRFCAVVVVDREAEQGVAVFEEQIGFRPGYAVDVRQADLHDPRLWTALDAKFGLAASEPVIVVGSGDPGENLRAALGLVARFPKARVVSRSFERSRFAEELAAGSGIEVFGVGQLVAENMPARWFDLAGPAR